MQTMTHSQEQFRVTNKPSFWSVEGNVEKTCRVHPERPGPGGKPAFFLKSDDCCCLQEISVNQNHLIYIC